METILALDPGKTTGYCLARKLTGSDVMQLAPGEEAFTLRELFTFIGGFVARSPQNCYMIYEDFNYRNNPRMGLDLTPVKMIGIIELWAERAGSAISTTKQTPSTGKAFYKDEELKRLGVYKVGKKHGRDATRHLLQWANFGAGGQFFNPDLLKYELIEVEEYWK